MEPITMKVINPGVKRSRKQDTQPGVGAGKSSPSRGRSVERGSGRLLPGLPRGPCCPVPGSEPNRVGGSGGVAAK